jgi:anti-sigma28 factor (negative regulator of flagellin synthesis)
MRIDPNSAVSPIARDTRESSPLAKPATSNTTPTGASVVKLSTAGAAVSADAPGPTTTSRLQTIRAMLDKGSYPVDLDALASRIVDDDVLRAGRS